MKYFDEKILLEIRTATIKEELAVPIYSSHITQALFWSGLPKKVQKKIIVGLKILERDSLRHAKLLRKVERIYSSSRK